MAVAAMALLCADVAIAEPDALARPAIMSRRASGAVMLAVRPAGSRLVAGGERGIILYSDDGGDTWTQAQVPVCVSITNLHFPSARLGWAVGHSGVILNSTDAGATWTVQLDGRKAAELVLSAVKQTPAESSEEHQRQTAEAERLVADGPDKPFFDVHFFDENNGLVVGAYGLILTTQDAGKTWMSLHQRIPNPKGKHLYSITTAGNAVYIAGEQGALFHASDRMAKFEEIKTPYAGTFFGVMSGNGQHLNVFGLRGNAYWSDDGKSWHKSETGASNTLTAGIRLKDGSLALVDEAGRLLLSRDGGASFKPEPMPKPSPLTSIVQTADGSLVVSGVRGLRRIAVNAQGEQSK